MPLKKPTESIPSRQWAAFFFVTLLALAAVFSGLYLPYDPRLLLGRGDLWNYTLPLSYFFDQRIHAGEWPDWNPLLFCGTPFSANPQSAAYYPLHLLRAILNFNPTPWRTVLSVLLEQGVHLLILAGGLFALARQHRMGFAGAAVAAVSFVISSALLDSAIQFWHFVAVLAWLPWSMLFLHRALMADTLHAKARNTLLLAGTFALNLLAGFPQMTLYVGLLLGVYGLMLRALHRKPEGWTRSTAALLGSDALVYLFMGIAGILLAAPMLVPAAIFSTLSDRAKGIGDEVALLNAIQLNVFRNPSQLFQLLVYYPGKADMRMLGATGFLLALCGLAHPRRKDVLIFGVLWLVLMDCALQPSLFFGHVVSVIAPFKIAGPQRAAVPACMMLAILAGFGADSLRFPAIAQVRPWARAFLWTVLGGALLLGLLRWCWQDPEYPLPTATTLGVLLLPTLAVGVILLAGHARFRSIAAPLLLVLLVLEVSVWNRYWLPMYIAQDGYPGDLAPLYDTHSISLANARGVGGYDPAGAVNPGENIGMFSLRPVMNGYDPLRVRSSNHFICDEHLEDRYNRYIRAEAPTQSHSRGYSFLKRRFWLSQTLSNETLPAKPAPLFPAQRVFGAGGTTPAAEAPTANLRAQPLHFPAPATTLRLPAEGYFPATQPAPDAPPRTRYLQVTFSGSTPEGRAQGVIVDATESPVLPLPDLRWTSANAAETVLLPLPDSSPIAARWEVVAPSNGVAPVLSVHHVLIYEDPADLPECVQITASTANGVTLQIRDLPEPHQLVFVEANLGWDAWVDDAPVATVPVNEAFLCVSVPAGTHTVRFAFRPLDGRLGLWIGVASLIAMAVLWLGLRWQTRRGTDANA